MVLFYEINTMQNRLNEKISGSFWSLKEGILSIIGTKKLICCTKRFIYLKLLIKEFTYKSIFDSYAKSFNYLTINIQFKKKLTKCFYFITGKHLLRIDTHIFYIIWVSKINRSCFFNVEFKKLDLV